MLNSLVTSGELPSLFSNDEMDGLLQVGIEIYCLGHQMHDIKSVHRSHMVYWNILEYTRIYRSILKCTEI